MKPLSATANPLVDNPPSNERAATVLFRVDGGPNIGAGHLMRCLGLVQELASRGVVCRLLTTTPEAPPVAIWRDEGIDVDILSPVKRDDANTTTALARQHNARWVVLDGYGFDTAYRRRIRAGCGAFLLSYVDQGPLPTASDLIVNQNPGAENRHRTRQNALLGSHFVSLRRSIRQLNRLPVPSKPNVLVTFGAAETSNLACRIANGLANLPDKFTADVALSNGAMKHSISDPRIKLTPYTNIIPLFARADLAICGGGVTSLELASLGVPMVLVRTAGNQTGINSLTNSGAAVYAGSGEKAIKRALIECRALLTDPNRRRQMSRQARRMIDGNGVVRIADAMFTPEN